MCLTCLPAFNCIGYVLMQKIYILALVAAWCLLQSERSTNLLGNKLFTAGHVIPRLAQLRSKCRSFSEPVKLSMGWDPLETWAMWAWTRLKLFKIGMNKCDVGIGWNFCLGQEDPVVWMLHSGHHIPVWMQDSHVRCSWLRSDRQEAQDFILFGFSCSWARCLIVPWPRGQLIPMQGN